MKQKRKFKTHKYTIETHFFKILYLHPKKKMNLFLLLIFLSNITILSLPILPSNQKYNIIQNSLLTDYRENNVQNISQIALKAPITPNTAILAIEPIPQIQQNQSIHLLDTHQYLNYGDFSNLNYNNNNNNNDNLINTLELNQTDVVASQEKIWWFVQITDIHLNLGVASRTAAFREFCGNTLKTLKPTFVIASGDILDGGHGKNPQQYIQDEEQYKLYRSILNEYNISDSFWYPVIGNHEQYNSYPENLSFWEDYVQNGSRTYSLIINSTFGKYRFIMLDVLQSLGLKNPFNLFGELTTPELDLLINLLEETKSNDEYNQTIVVGHIPLNEIYSHQSSDGRRFIKILNDYNVLTYLTGHVHLEGLYTTHGQLIEAMAPAFKDKYYYRISVFDNDIFSFSDVKLGEWPAIVITNPTDRRFSTNRQPMDRQITDNEIRALLFDPKGITSAQVFIDDVYIGDLTNQAESIGNMTISSSNNQSNIWKLKWNPSKYSENSHKITIIVNSLSGTQSKSFYFKLGSTQPYFELSWQSLFLRLPFWNFMTLLSIIFFILSEFKIFNISIIHNKKISKKYINKEESISNNNNNTNDSNDIITNINNNNNYNKKRKREISKKLEKINLEHSNQFSKWFYILNALLPIFIITLPIFILPLFDSTWGYLTITGVFVIGRHIYSPYSVATVAVAQLINYIFLNLQINIKEKKSRFWLRWNLFWAIVVYFSLFIIWAEYYSILIYFISPFGMIYSLIIITLVLYSMDYLDNIKNWFRKRFKRN